MIKKLDLKVLLPTVAAFIAFILTLMCLFAGTEKGLMDDVHLLTVRDLKMRRIPRSR